MTLPEPPDGWGILFKVASSPGAGGGHMERCLALAQAMGTEHPVTFVLDPECGDGWPERLQIEGFALFDPSAVVDVVMAPIVILDDYGLTATDVASWRRRAKFVVMIEDKGNRFDGIDLYISPGRIWTNGAKMLSGPEYALLAAEYAAPDLPPPNGSEVGHLLISFGLRDTNNVTGLALEAVALLPCRIRPRQLTVILGGKAPHLGKVAKQIAGFGGHLVTDAPGLRSYYDASDLVIGAGGVSLFERLARGRPSITIVTADNQDCQVKDVSNRGGTRFAGSGDELSAEALSFTINELICNGVERMAMASRGRSIVDGAGARRAAEAIMAFTRTGMDRS